tara:strand:+ start:1310 stop:2053 length:744 start_codon:yes stop_codon:yes gene_type:complete
VIWWTILKNIKGPYTPVEFQTEEEIEDIAEDRKKRNEIYGRRVSNFDVNLGNLKTLNELRATYFPESNRFKWGGVTGIFSDVTQINFDLVIRGEIIERDDGNDIIRLEDMNIDIFADSNKYIPILIDYYGYDKPKVVSDWVELYNKPSHKYKNMRAFINVRKDYRLRTIHSIREKILKVLNDNYIELLKLDPLEYGDINFPNHNIANKTLDTKISNNRGGTYIIGFGDEESMDDVLNIVKYIRGLNL